MYEHPRLDSFATMGDKAEENPDEEYGRNFIDILIELGKMCGFENLCDQPYTSDYSHFGSVCNFPCSENYNCCKTLA